MIRLENSDHGMLLLVNVEKPTENMLIQTDRDYPGIASNFGWVPCPFCRSTDGTVDCRHRTASAMIHSARNFLDTHIGQEVENPGYFEDR